MDEQEFRSILSDYEKMNDAAEKEVAALREAIAAWPAIFRKENESVDFFELFERIAEINAARENARRVAGLED
jgi:hypothetical protein